MSLPTVLFLVFQFNRFGAGGKTKKALEERQASLLAKEKGKASPETEATDPKINCSRDKEMTVSQIERDQTVSYCSLSYQEQISTFFFKNDSGNEGVESVYGPRKAYSDISFTSQAITIQDFSFPSQMMLQSPPLSQRPPIPISSIWPENIEPPKEESEFTKEEERQVNQSLSKSRASSNGEIVLNKSIEVQKDEPSFYKEEIIEIGSSKKTKETSVFGINDAMTFSAANAFQEEFPPFRFESQQSEVVYQEEDDNNLDENGKNAPRGHQTTYPPEFQEEISKIAEQKQKKPARPRKKIEKVTKIEEEPNSLKKKRKVDEDFHVFEEDKEESSDEDSDDSEDDDSDNDDEETGSRSNPRQKGESKLKKRGKYMKYTVDFKTKAIKDAKEFGIKKAATMNKVTKKNLARWVSKGANRKKGGGRCAFDVVMEQKLVDWMTESIAKSGGKLPAAKYIRQKSREYSMYKEKFKASKGWCEKFTKRYIRNHMSEEGQAGSI